MTRPCEYGLALRRPKRLFGLESVRVDGAPSSETGSLAPGDTGSRPPPSSPRAASLATERYKKRRLVAMACIETLPVPAGQQQEREGGRFRPGVSGNPRGRPVGSRNHATLAAAALLEGEAEAITRKAVELALAGDPVALRLCMERILPPMRERPRPAIEADGPRDALAQLSQRVLAGEMDADQGCRMLEFVDRLAELHARLPGADVGEEEQRQMLLTILREHAPADLLLQAARERGLVPRDASRLGSAACQHLTIGGDGSAVLAGQWSSASLSHLARQWHPQPPGRSGRALAQRRPSRRSGLADRRRACLRSCWLPRNP